MAIFLAPPSYTNNEVVTDPSFVGIFQSQPYAILMNPFVFDFNSFIASIPPPFTGLNAPITLYFQAITLYDIAINLPYVSVPGNPIDAAQSNTIELTIQPEIIVTTNQDCLNNWIEFSVEQAGMGNITFDINNAYPVVANFPNSISNQTTEIINNISGNNVPFGMLITNPDGCSSALNDNFIGTFTATLAPVGNLCESDNPIVLVASPAGGTWMGNPQVLNNETFTPSGVNINSNTIYTVVYTPPTPPGGCAVSASIDINVIPDANSQFTAPTAMCINENPVTLQTAVGGGVWSSPNNSVSNQGIFTPSLSGAGIQTIIYSIGGTCPSYTTHDVVVHDLPTIQFDASATEGCLPLTIDFSNTTAGTGSNFIWTIDGITEAIGVDAFSHTFENSLCSSIGLTLTDQNGCTNHLDSLNLICPYPDPIVDFEYNPENPTLADFELTFQETMGYTAVNFWDFGDGQSSYDWAPSHYYDVVVPSEFEVCLTGYDVNGCDATTCKFIQLQSGFEIYCPNAFTPGNDGVNDGFRPLIVSKKEIYKYKMQIFNRNGEKIFETDDYNTAWYGNSFNGDDYVRDGFYTFIIEINLEGLSERQTFKGNVLIVR